MLGRINVAIMEDTEQAQELSREEAGVHGTGSWQVLWFFVHLTAVYVIVNFCTPWLAGWTRGRLLPFLGHPTSSGGLEFLFTHIFAFSFFPALLAGMNNEKFKHRAAEFVWLVPTAILTYKVLTFTSTTLVFAQNGSWPAFHHYFGGGFLIPHTNNWKDFWTVVGSNGDAPRGMDQLKFTAPNTPHWDHFRRHG